MSAGGAISTLVWLVIIIVVILVIFLLLKFLFGLFFIAPIGYETMTMTTILPNPINAIS